MIMRLFFTFLLIATGVSVCFAATPGELARSGRYDEAINAYMEAIEREGDKGKRAILYKELGSVFESREDFAGAADHYITALSLSRDFSEPERLRMATRMAWGRRFDSSISQLNLILGENPDNLDARVQLARTLSWNGDLSGSIREADKVLEISPGNRDALLVKANTLKWQGQVKESLRIYENLLLEGEDFDVRLGYSYALISAGDRKGARQSASLLKPEYPYHERELKNFLHELAAATRPRIDTWYSYYSDTDNNRLNRYGLRYGQWLDNVDLGFEFQHVDGKDDARRNWAQNINARAYWKINKTLGLGGGVGFSPVSNSETNYFVTGNVRGDISVLNGTAGFSFARDVFIDTAQLIENRIRVDSANAYFTQRFADRLTLFGRYSYKDYSDRNHSHDALLAPACTLYKGVPAVGVGYRFRYLDFDRQSGGGYFDPDDFTSHQLFVTLSAETEKFSAYLEPYLGLQSFRRNGINNDDFIGGVIGSLGYQLTKILRLEVNGEYGNSAVETAAGFRYYLVGARIGIVF